jgi:DNA-directed RNA polymerase specialized sigma24 family protein
VLTLLHLEGRSVAEVRQITGWNVPVIKVRAFRARRKAAEVHFEKLMEEKLGTNARRKGAANMKPN